MDADRLKQTLPDGNMPVKIIMELNGNPTELEIIRISVINASPDNSQNKVKAYTHTLTERCRYDTCGNRIIVF